MITVINIPLINGEDYSIEFAPITLKSTDGEKNHTTTLVAKTLLTWKLILGIEKLIVYYDKNYTADEYILDIGYHPISELIKYLNQYAPSVYRFDLITEEEWVLAKDESVINKNNSAGCFELTDTWDYKHCTPDNSAGTGVSYFALGINDDYPEGYWKRSVSEVYGEWGCSLGIRLVLRELPPSPKWPRFVFDVLREIKKRKKLDMDL